MSVLEVRNLKRKVGDREIITQLSFTVREADVLFIRGPSGVGKSLLLRALAYLDPLQVCCTSQTFKLATASVVQSPLNIL